MQHSIPHSLDHAIARRATAHALDSYKARFSEYSPQGQWKNEDEAVVSFEVAGKRLEGAVAVRPRSIDLELDVPLIFRPFRSMAMKVIEDEIQMWIDKARRGEIV